MKRRLLAVLILLCLLAPGALAASDPYGSVALMRARGVNEYGGAVQVILSVRDLSGSETSALWLGKIQESMLEHGALQSRVWDLGDGRYYTETRLGWEGVHAEYALYQRDGGGLKLIYGATDPGYSDGMGLYDAVTGRALFEDGSCYNYDGMIAALNGAFSAYGLTFALQQVKMGGIWGTTQLPGAKLSARNAVCEVNTDGLYSLSQHSSVAGRSAAEQSAPGYAITTGQVNLRKGPGKNYGSITAIPAGTTVEYLGETEYDERPVAWYHVNYNGKEGWVSSAYAELLD